MNYRFITIKPVNGYTLLWNIFNKKSGVALGSISLYPGWRRKRLVLQSDKDMVWTWDCLKNVAGFMEEQEKQLEMKPNVPLKPQK
jgi:hypothetical protein